MAKTRFEHCCQECGATTPRWEGRCPGCGAWNSLVEQVVAGARQPTSAPLVDAVALGSIDPQAGEARATGLGEFDRTLSGGFVPGSVTLIGGEPGIGKSTLLLQVASELSRAKRRVVIASAEESAEQISRRAQRLGVDTSHIVLCTTSSLPAVLDVATREKPDLLIIDSIQTISDPEVSGSAGSVSQVRECAGELVNFAKRSGVATVLIGHVTKEGSLAGPRLLEHLVDTVCSFEGDRHHALRVLSVIKHRFGPAGELGVFEMTTDGLKGVADPSALFLSDRQPGVAGSIVVPVLEGHRALLIELQTLVTPTVFGTPRRSAEGVASGRLALILAVLEQRVGLLAGALDVFASVVGGVHVQEPGADLALGLALASAVTGVPIDPLTVACGEVGLAGEVRQVVHTERRLQEAARRGFRRAIVPMTSPAAPSGMELVRVATLHEAVQLLGLMTVERAS
jgi:DNA repair protein RadA/Sms